MRVVKFLLTQAQARNDGFIALNIARLEIIKHATTLSNHDQQATARVKVFFMVFQMLCEITNPLRENGDLDFRRTGIIGASGEFSDKLLLALWS